MWPTMVHKWEVVIYEDEDGKIVGSPQNSGGYVYVCGWLARKGSNMNITDIASTLSLTSRRSTARCVSSLYRDGMFTVRDD